MKPIKLIALSLLFASATLSMAQNPSDYVPKVYPQQQETASTARLVQDGDTYTFSNDLFEAKFIKQDNTLKFGGCEQMNLLAGTELFTVKFGDGSVVRKASEMTLQKVETKHVSGNDKAVKGSHHFDGEQLVATFTTVYDGKTITLTWTAELREGSHYLKTNLDIKASDNVKMFAVIPMQYNFNATDAKAPMPQGDPRLRGRVLSNGSMFACLDTPTAFNTAGGSVKDTSYNEADVLRNVAGNWTPQSWEAITNNDNVPWRIREFGYDNNSVKSYNVSTVEVTESGSVNVEFLYQSGNNRLNMVGVELIDSNGQVAGGDYHIGYTGNAKENNVYSIDVKTAGTYTVRCYVQGKTEPLNSSGTITTRVIRKAVEEMNTADIVPLEGLWKRDATLRKDEPWSVGSVVGLMAEGQDRRSFLAYLERERAVPWRPFPMYNSWYEINIGRTNTHSDPAQNMKVEDAVRVVQHWKEKMFDNYGVSIKSFVWDDGWDNLSTWEPSCNFPNGFYEPKLITDEMCSHQGAWLGPTGGYDTAGGARKNYWSTRGGAGLDNRAYYEAFTKAVKNLCTQYDFNYYKFDGIGGPATAFAPREGNAGNEQCEGIIALERDIRNTIQEDVFFNTTVGTWASPLWLNISDCVWRQDQDHYLQGNNTNTRERWITYRDNLIYEHFVDESPLMTINSMMSHGFILTKYGLDITKNMPRDFESVKREMRCAFACGSSQVELYCDYDLMDSICKEENNPETAGALWEELANCIKWQRKNADVLPDIHWVGNDPYTTQENIYGWAAWNGNKAVFSLRNGNNNEQSYEFTLREALNIPTSAPTTTITFTKPFADQADLFGLNVGEPINIDTRLTVKLPGSTVYMFDGIDNSGELVLVNNLSFDEESINIPVGVAKAPAYLVSPLSASNKSLEWTSADPTIAKVTDGAITALKIGTTTITAKALDGSNKTMTITVNVTENKKFDLDKVIEEITEAYEANNVDTWGEKIIKDNSVFSSNASDSTEGTSFPLTDGSGTTYWHSNYHDGKQASHSHYLQVTLPTAVEGTLQVEMMRRINKGQLCANDNPLEFDVQVSATGNDDDWKSVGNITFPRGSVEEPTVTSSFTVDAPYRYFRFWGVKMDGENRGYFHVGDFQLKPLVTPSLNSTHVAAAEALQAALADARKLTEVTDEHIAALQQAFEDYKTAIGEAVTPPAAGPTATITAVFPNGTRHTVFSDSSKLTAAAEGSIPADAIATFEVVSKEDGAVVLKAGNQFIHLSCGEDSEGQKKMSDWDGLSESENDWTTLTFEPASNDGNTSFAKHNNHGGGTWDTSYEGLYQIKGKTSNGETHYFTLRSADNQWLAGNPNDKFFDSNWNGNGYRTSFFEVTFTEPVEEVLPYVFPLNFEYDRANTRNDRNLRSISLQVEGSEAQSFTVDPAKIYSNLTETAVFTCAPGDKLTANVGGEVNWMNAYFYIDLDHNKTLKINNGQLDQTGTELLSYSFWTGSDAQDETGGQNSAGTALSGSQRNTRVLPPFTAPTEPGTYNVRFKLDWNSIDPAGDINSANNDIFGNGGYIVDAVLKVVAASVDDAKAEFDAAQERYTTFFESNKDSENQDVQALLYDLMEKVFGMTLELPKNEADITAEQYKSVAAAVNAALDEAEAALQDILNPVANGLRLPIASGVYEIQNAATIQNRGYLVDYTGYKNGPSLAECHLSTHESKHPAERNKEGETCSYWYVHEKDGQYYIISLSSLQEGNLRFLNPSGNKQASAYSEEPVALTITESTLAYTVDGDDREYKYMLIANAATPTYVLSASCGTASTAGAVKSDDNKEDGGAPWKFIWTGLAPETEQPAEIRTYAIRTIEADATIDRIVDYIEKAKDAKALKEDINLLRDIILKK